MYFSLLELPCKEKLVSIERDEDVRESVGLCKSLGYVNLYVEHNDEVDFIESNESNDDHINCTADYEYDEYGSDVEMRNLLELERNKKRRYMRKYLQT